MPVQPRRLVAGRVVQQQDLAHPFNLGNGLGQMIQKELEHARAHAVHDRAEQLAGLRTDCPDDILSNVSAQIWLCASFPRLAPAAARARTAFDPALGAEP